MGCSASVPSDDLGVLSPTRAPVQDDDVEQDDDAKNLFANVTHIRYTSDGGYDSSEDEALLGSMVSCEERCDLRPSLKKEPSAQSLPSSFTVRFSFGTEECDSLYDDTLSLTSRGSSNSLASSMANTKRVSLRFSKKKTGSGRGGRDNPLESSVNSIKALS